MAVFQLDGSVKRTYIRAHDERHDHRDLSPPPHPRGMGG